ncbi:hypothetical protein [Aeromicrobium sp. Sec7.5]|uniref:hypothetical protein n=1 Tax=Aeromicrobium sp. Sec7.5 TaxID=3121276 RepID=UPI002FE46CF3
MNSPSSRWIASRTAAEPPVRSRATNAKCILFCFTTRTRTSADASMMLSSTSGSRCASRIMVRSVRNDRSTSASPSSSIDSKWR